MTRPRPIWITFLLFLACGLGAMAWMTRTVIRLDEAQARATAAAALAQARATAAADLEENVRLALWRMDGALAPTLNPEIARPYFEYSAVFPAERAYTRMYTELKSGDVLVPSPLLKSPQSPYILLHFQVEPDGRVTSPQAPTGDVRKVAQQRYATAADIDRARQRLGEVAQWLKAPAVLAAVPAPLDPVNWNNSKIRVASAGGSISNGTLSINRDNYAQNPRGANADAANGYNTYNGNTAYPNPPPQQQQALSYEQQAVNQVKRGQQEFAARQQAQAETNEMLVNTSTANLATPGVSFGVMTKVWVGDGGDTLILARRVSINGQSYVQGCLLDWPAIRKSLLASTADLLDGADLVPVRAATDDKQPRMLASIPARLVLTTGAPGAAAAPDEGAGERPDGMRTVLAYFQNRSPTAVTLAIAWLGVLLAGAAVAVLLRGVIALSQRRAGFVSAVTHELRTPLTTLRMYTEMLADGMVADPAQQASYHKTLRAEANRLGHLVDNVLLYSRLERSARDTRVEAAPLAELLDRLTPRLTDRAAQAGMTLNVRVDAAVADGARIRANLLSVEQILFNLVDNACKYAAGASDRTITMNVDRRRDRVRIRLSDHGPGLDAAARSRLFQPFSKSVHEAADTAPGLGLGLALSHRLAKNMNADLRLDEAAGDGAAFVLTLPAE